MYQSPTSKQFILPDLLLLCPWKGSTNSYYEQAGTESSAWIDGYKVFTNRKRAFFVQCSNELLVSHTYPYAGFNLVMVSNNTSLVVLVVFIIDEISDDQNGHDARATGQIFLEAIRHPEREDNSTLGKITRDFRTRFVRLAGPGCMRRFLKHCEDYVECVAREAKLREQGEVLDLTSFTALRRENSAIRLCFGLFEYVLGVDLPDRVFEDPVFMSLYWAAADMVCWSNDVYSYDMEQAKGHGGNNVITVLMKERQIDLQTAANEVGVYFGELMKRFTADKKRLPSWGPSIDGGVTRYIEALSHWVIGNLEWSFETPRYFGADHRRIKNTRLITLAPYRGRQRNSNDTHL